MADGILPLLLGVIFIFIGLVILLLAASGYIKGQKSKNWPSVNGVIIESRVESGIDDIPSFDVSYVYYVDNVKYTGRNTTPSGIIKNPQKALKQYPKNSNVEVFYNPSKHDDALLKLEKHSQIPIQVKMAIFFSFIAGGYFLYQWWA